MSICISNKHFHYFVVECAIDVPSLKNCKLHCNEDELFEYVANATGEDADLLSVAPIRIQSNQSGFNWCDSRGVWTSIELEHTTLEEWVSEFEM